MRFFPRYNVVTASENIFFEGEFMESIFACSEKFGKDIFTTFESGCPYNDTAIPPKGVGNIHVFASEDAYMNDDDPVAVIKKIYA
jgi:hypothetical protein